MGVATAIDEAAIAEGDQHVGVGCSCARRRLQPVWLASGALGAAISRAPAAAGAS